MVTIGQQGNGSVTYTLSAGQPLHDLLDRYYASFEVDGEALNLPINGLFGYMNFDAVRYFEKIDIKAPAGEAFRIPEVKYCFYKYVIAIDHHKNQMYLVENLREGESSQMDYLHHLLVNLNFITSGFRATGEETSNLTDEEFRKMVTKGKAHCHRGDVFQVVFSRQFSQSFDGDDFNVYRALRSVNPSPIFFILIMAITGFSVPVRKPRSASKGAGLPFIPLREPSGAPATMSMTRSRPPCWPLIRRKTPSM